MTLGKTIYIDERPYLVEDTRRDENGREWAMVYLPMTRKYRWVSVKD